MADFDGDGVREVAAVAASDAVRRERDARGREAVRSRQDELRAAFSAGRLTMAEYAKAAREAGITAKEVGAALQERAAAEKRMEEREAHAKAQAQSASKQPDELAAAHGAKAQGLYWLKKGEVAEAAEAFEDAASIGAMASEALIATGSDQRPAILVRSSSLLNAALCHMKLEAWPQVEAACDAVLALDDSSAKARYRRGVARLRQSRPIDAATDLAAAAALTPNDKDVRKALVEAEAAAEEARKRLAAQSPEAASGEEAAPSAKEKVGASGGANAASDVPSASRRPNVERRSYAFLDLTIGGRAAGRLCVQLFDDLVPRTCANFRAFCNGVPRPQSGTGGEGVLCYRGSPFHRIVKGFCVQGGDVVSGDGSCGVSSLEGGGPLPDESFAVPHARPGILSMANMGQPNTNGCQFFITLAAAPECDGKHVAFGRLIGGIPLLRRLEALPTDAADRPTEAALISDCGELEAAQVASLMDAGLDDEEASGVGGGLDLGGEALLHAALEGDTRLVRELIERGVPVDAFGSVEAPRELLGASAAIDAAVQTAADAEESDAASMIDCAALAVAARTGNVEMTRGLLETSADPALVDSSGRCALHWAALAGSAPCVIALLDAKADAAAADGSGRTAAHIACANGHMAVLEAVLRRRPDAAHDVASGLTPLHLAAAADLAEGVDLLVGAKAAIDTLAVGELSPAHLAAARGALCALNALLAAGANIALAGERSGKQPLHAACEHGRATVVGVLLAARAAVGAPDAHRSTPLHWASKAGSHESIAVLLSAGAQPDALTKDGSSALHLACEAGAPQCVALLLRSRGDHAAADGHGVVPLHAASSVGSVACVRMLLSANADVHAQLRISGKHQLSSLKELHCKTSLYLAAENGHIEVVRALLESGAQPNALATIETAQAVTRTSPLWAAKRGGHTAVAEVLAEAGGVESAEQDGKEEEEAGAAEGAIPVLV